jgi:aspartate racemase
MKTIGLLGGMSWESTAEYYRAINTGVSETLGGLHSAEIILYSVDFAPIEERQTAGDWSATAEILVDAARRIQRAGADFLLICTNTMHRVAPAIELAITIPLLHIADATAEALVRDGVKTVGLLGTAFTMEQNFYTGRLADRYGLKVIVPEREARRHVHTIIYDELCRGKLLGASRKRYLSIVDDLASAGAEAVILGCTEIGLLIKPGDTAVRLYDTTALHAAQAVRWALEGD